MSVARKEKEVVDTLSRASPLALGRIPRLGAVTAVELSHSAGEAIPMVQMYHQTDIKVI